VQICNKKNLQVKPILSIFHMWKVKNTERFQTNREYIWPQRKTVFKRLKFKYFSQNTEILHCVLDNYRLCSNVWAPESKSSVRFALARQNFISIYCVPDYCDFRGSFFWTEISGSVILLFFFYFCHWRDFKAEPNLIWYDPRSKAYPTLQTCKLHCSVDDYQIWYSNLFLNYSQWFSLNNTWNFNLNCCAIGYNVWFFFVTRIVLWCVNYFSKKKSGMLEI
jgi:hypothetical protein